ncbi:DUF3037 domain-containing protein [Patiriisocius marinus]|uniref:DUF3037 domain-containing protein n=1 Tax=Patiriisocius marinus TaxID=1397112 RepID=A0A5J4IVX4_9FLAO|nr:DUF3037 domain-containing protein [Patiriisocius marinus]GER59084.1 hypothetical protein ULMA_11920 [Patiriisocius marinus]
MQDKCTFEYAIIRLVPKVEREEFFNVGVILFSKRKKYLGIRYQIDETKFNAFAPELSLEDFKKYLNAWKLICDGEPSGGTIGTFELSDRFRWLTACRSTIIQSSKTHPGLTDNPENELETIFKMYIL